MLIQVDTLKRLGQTLLAERKRQRLTREQAAAISGVSPSFIRDAEEDPASCSVGKLVQLCRGLGFVLTITEPAASTADELSDVPAEFMELPLNSVPQLGNPNPVFNQVKSFGLRAPTVTADALREHWKGTRSELPTRRLIEAAQGLLPSTPREGPPAAKGLPPLSTPVQAKKSGNDRSTSSPRQIAAGGLSPSSSRVGKSEPRKN